MSDTFVLLADLHLRDNDPLGRGSGLENSRLQRKLSILQAAVRRAVEEQATLVLLGDIFDSPRIPEWLRLKFFQTIAPRMNGGAVWYVGDNHTLSQGTWPFGSETLIGRMSKEENSPDPFRFFTEDWYVHHDWWTIAILPFGTESNLASLPVEAPSRTIIFGHWPVMGAFYGAAGVRSDKGVPVEALAPFHSVFLGDFHKRQDVFDRPVGNVVARGGSPLGGFRGYVGSAAASDFGEVGYVHQMAVLRLVDSPRYAYELEWVDTGDSPMVQLDISYVPEACGRLDGWYPEQWEKSLSGVPTGALVKLRFIGTREQLAVLDQRPYFEQLSSAEFIRVETKLLDDFGPTDDQLAGIPDALSAEDLIVEASGADEPRRQLGLEIFRAVSP